MDRDGRETCAFLLTGGRYFVFSALLKWLIKHSNTPINVYIYWAGQTKKLDGLDLARLPTPVLERDAEECCANDRTSAEKKIYIYMCK